MGSKHKKLAGMEETRLLRDFNRLGLDPIPHYTEFYDGEYGEEDHQFDGWLMFSPREADELLEMIGRFKQ